MLPRTTNRGKSGFIKAMLLLAFLLLVGTVGYTILDPGMDLFSSFYMTVITISTVGFGEATYLTQAGRAFTVFLIFAGIGLVSYVLFVVSQAVVEGQLQQFLGRRKVDRQIEKLNNHVILCGFGRIGMIIAEELRKYGKEFVVIDKEPDLKESLDAGKYLYIIGDSTEDTVLKQAGILRASALIAAMYPDANNIYLTLTARELNPDITVVCRAYEKKAEKRLLRAGANKIIYPDRMGGRRIAFSLIRPAMVTFLDVLSQSFAEGDIELDELTIGDACSLRGRNLKEADIRSHYNIIILAIRKQDGSMNFNPGGNTIVESGDALLAIGIRNDLLEFARRMDAQELTI